MYHLNNHSKQQIVSWKLLTLRYNNEFKLERHGNTTNGKLNATENTKPIFMASDVRLGSKLIKMLPKINNHLVIIVTLITKNDDNNNDSNLLNLWMVWYKTQCIRKIRHINKLKYKYWGLLWQPRSFYPELHWVSCRKFRRVEFDRRAPWKRLEYIEECRPVSNNERGETSLLIIRESLIQISP